MSSWSTAKFFGPLLLLWTLPPLALVGLTALTDRAESEVVSASLPDIVVVGERTQDYRSNVDITVTLAPAVPARLAIGGLVTAVGVKPGADLVSGMNLFTIDGVAICAYAGDRPLYREIGPGVKGEDVAALSAFLASIGYPNEITEKSAYTRSLRNAIRDYEEAIGTTKTGVFSPTYVVYVPATASSVSTVPIQVGSRVEADAIALTFPDQPVTMRIEGSSGAPAKILQVAGPYGLTVGDETVRLEALPAEPAAVAAVYSALTAAGIPPAAPPEDGNPTATYSGLDLAVLNAVTVGTVPTSAVYSTPAGVTCLFTPDRTSAKAVQVESALPLEGEIGLLAVDADLIGDSVVRDPALLPAGALAGCT